MNLSLLTVLCHDKNNSQLKELLKNNKILDFINTLGPTYLTNHLTDHLSLSII